MKPGTRILGTLAVLSLLAAVPAAAQETRGSIEGVVRDASGGVLPGVNVEARSPSMVGLQVVVTDTNGVYRFPALPPGTFEVTASMTGFTTRREVGIQLALGQMLRVDFQLPVGGLSEDVHVTAESPLIDVKQNASALSLQSELIDRIPKGRNFTTVITSAPGANQEAKAGGIQIDGASGSENRYIIDGLDTTSLRTGVSQKDLLTDFLSEVQVKSSGYNAEYRAATGGVISAITRTGSNAWRGSFGTYYSNDRWLGDVRQSLRLNPANQTLSEYIATPRDPAYTVEPLMDFGGPLLQSRAWFYAGYIPQISRQERTVTFNSNNETRSFESNSEDHNVQYNVTGQLRSNLRGKFAVGNWRRIGGATLPGKEPNGTSNSNFALFPNPLTTNSSNDGYSANIDWVVSPKLFVAINTGYLTYNAWQVTTTQFNEGIRRTFSASNTCNPTAVPGSSGCPFPEIPASLQQLNGFADAQVNTRNVRDKYGRYSLNLDGTYYANRGGQHTLKAGVQYERLSNDVLGGQQGPNISLFWNASRTTLDDPPRVVRGTYGYYNVSRIYTEGAIHSNNLGFFLQDAWTVNNRLTLNLGIRTEMEKIPSYRPENPSIDFGFKDKIAPRVGFAYDLKGDGRWKAYGSWGMFYDISKLEMPRGLFGADRWVNYYFTLDTFDWTSINCSYPPVGGASCPGTFIEQVDSRHIANAADKSEIDPGLKPIRSQEFTLGLDRELSRTMAVGVRYVHKWLDRTIEDVGIQVAGVGEIFMIANPGFGIAEYTLSGQCPSCPAQPKAKRDYDGLEFRLRKRLANSWSLNTSYLYSRLYGNYSGLANSDENGRTSPSVNRIFDGLYMAFDQTGQPVFGRLQTDRPHQWKLQTTYDFRWGTGIGVEYLLESGTPQQSTITVRSVPVFDQGRGNLGRSPAFSQTNLYLQHDLRLPGRTRVNLGVNVNNLFDQDIVTRIFTTRYRDQIPVGNEEFFAGFDAQAIAASRTTIRDDPRFMLPDQYQGARTVRVHAKLVF